jgi:hypothetical protein
MTLLEVLIASAMLATIVTSVSVVIRSSHTAWLTRESDYTQAESAHAVTRHLLRQIRQAEGVLAVTAASDTDGSLSLLMPSGETYVWARDSGADEVLFGVDSADDLLAEYITELSFTCYTADGVTATTNVEQIQAIQCTVAYELAQGASGTREVTCWGWVRSW